MKLLAIDGNSILNRAFYGIRTLSTSKGVYTNGIYGFLNILLKLKEKEQPDAVAVAFDLRAPTFRHKEYAEYKAGRKAMPEELAVQFPILKELLGYLGVTCLSLEGYEADDILGTLARLAENDSAHTCVIATGDRDSLQLVSEQTTVLLSRTEMGHPAITECTPEYIAEKYGVEPSGMIEIKALMGDSSDNIPGVAGIGEKTACALITEYKTIDYIYENLDSLDIKPTVKAKLISGKDSAILSRRLGTICKEVPLDLKFEDFKNATVDTAAASRFMCELELFSLLPKFELDRTDVTAKEEKTVAEIKAVGLNEFISAAKEEGKFSALVEEGFGFSASGKVYIAENDENARKVMALDVKKNLYDSKNIYNRLNDNSYSSSTVFDNMLAAYLINPNLKDLSISSLAASYGIGIGEGIEGLAAANELLEEKLEAELKKLGMYELLLDVELPLAAVLSDMERNGFLIDVDGIKKYGDELSVRIEKLRESVIADVGYEFNLNSPKQLGVALFETLNLPCKKKTKSGYSTSADVLEELKYESETVAKLLEYRGLTKLKSTYCDGLCAAVSQDGRVRSVFNQTETRTGRISSSEPNLQNIPVRKEEGRQLRGFFTAKDGYMLVDADYSQIELRVLAAASSDKAMCDAFNSGVDIHTATASEVFKMPLDMVTSGMRSRAKAVNFGIVYGIGAFSLAKDVGVSFKEAKQYISDYLMTYSGVDKFMKSSIENAKENGYAVTLFGRRRPIPEIRSSNGMERSFGERVARNAPIQGTAADIIKIAMVKVSKRLQNELPDSKLILQVHDELILEVPEKDVEKASVILKEEMENAVSLSVKMVADVHSGKTWLEAKD